MAPIEPTKNQKNEKDYFLPTVSLLFGLLRDAKGLRGRKQKAGDKKGIVPGREPTQAQEKRDNGHEHRLYLGRNCGSRSSLGFEYLFEKIAMAKSKKHQKPLNLKSTKNHKKHAKRVQGNLAVLRSL